MLHEMIYTSAPKGLKPGTSGFCTVAATAGMTEQMEQRLEKLTAYRPMYDLLSRDGHRNPAAYGHWRVFIGGQSYSVLSHISFPGASHTGRAHKFAHLVALQGEDQVTAGPAWLLMQPGVMEKQWDGEPRRLPPGRSIPSGANPPRPCVDWERATGDAGWAGAVVDAYLRDASRPVYVIYQPGIDLLPLINEVIALLPEQRRWGFTFSTYFTDLPAEAECFLRCCAAGTDSVKSAYVQATSGLVIDLTKPAGPARDSAYVVAARTGALVKAVEKMVTAPERATTLRDRPDISLERAGTGAATESTYGLMPERVERQPKPQPGAYSSVGHSGSVRPRRTLATAAWILWPVPLLALGWFLHDSKVTGLEQKIQDEKRERTAIVNDLNEQVQGATTERQALKAELATIKTAKEKLEGENTQLNRNLANALARAEKTTEASKVPPEAQAKKDTTGARLYLPPESTDIENTANARAKTNPPATAETKTPAPDWHWGNHFALLYNKHIQLQDDQNENVGVLPVGIKISLGNADKNTPIEPKLEGQLPDGVKWSTDGTISLPNQTLVKLTTENGRLVWEWSKGADITNVRDTQTFLREDNLTLQWEHAGGTKILQFKTPLDFEGKWTNLLNKKDGRLEIRAKDQAPRTEDPARETAKSNWELAEVGKRRQVVNTKEPVHVRLQLFVTLQGNEAILESKQGKLIALKNKVNALHITVKKRATDLSDMLGKHKKATEEDQNKLSKEENDIDEDAKLSTDDKGTKKQEKQRRQARLEQERREQEVDKIQKEIKPDIDSEQDKIVLNDFDKEELPEYLDLVNVKAWELGNIEDPPNALKLLTQYANQLLSIVTELEKSRQSFDELVRQKTIDFIVSNKSTQFVYARIEIKK